jgi:hypothetical protein
VCGSDLACHVCMGAAEDVSVVEAACFATAQEGNSVVAALPSLRPAAARCGALVRLLLAWLKACPSGLCLNKTFARKKLEAASS